jgi:hypothetical protein
MPAIENSYASTLMAGIFGTILVLGVSYTVGMAIAKKGGKTNE